MKKNEFDHAPGIHFPGAAQILLKMKLTLIIIIFSFFGAIASDSYAQTKLSLDLKNTTVRNALDAIEKQSEFFFLYSEKLIDVNRKVDVEVQQSTVDKVLDQIFEGTNVNYTVKDRQIVLTTPEANLPEGITSGSQQQKKTVSGKVTDSSGGSLPGVTILVKGTTNGTITDAEGNYTISNLPEKGALQFSFVGMKTQEVLIGGKSRLDVSLADESIGIEEVVAVGYGTQKKLNLTGAIDQVTGEKLENRPVANITQSLQGVMPNLNITLIDGKPIQAPSYNIRGTTSIGQGGSALVLIDGVEGDPSLLNPNDIKSISLLKDAASASIYGARGVFGVVLINTKNPEKGKISVDFSSNIAFKKPIGVPDLVTDGYTYVKMFSESFINGDGAFPQNINKTQKFSQAYLDAFKAKVESGQPYNEVEIDPVSGEYVYFASSDYYGELYKDNTMASDNNISISGSGDKTTFLLSGRYMSQNGLFRYNSDDYNILNFRAKGSIQLTHWLAIINSIDYSEMKYHNPLNTGEGQGIWRNIAAEGHPSSPFFNPDGTLTMSSAWTVGDFWYNKNGIDTKRGVFRNTIGFTSEVLNNTLRFNGNVTVSKTNNNIETKQVQVPYSNKPGVTSFAGTKTNDLSVDLSERSYIVTNLTTEYENTFGDTHFLKVLAGYSFEQSVYNRLRTKRNGLIYEDASDMNLALGPAIVTEGGYEKWQILGGFSRINYSYKDRYLLEVNARYDGSSKFPSNQRYAFFPSVSGGWRLSKETFWNVTPEIFSDFKLRASYGSLGNGNVNSYAYQEQISVSQGGNILNGVRPQKANNPSVLPDGLTWETSTISDFGLDFAMFADRLKFVGDYYIRNTTGMYTIGLTLPEVFGATPPKGNYADLQTKGWELTLSWRDKFNIAAKPLNYSFRFTLADNKAVITKYNNPDKLLSDYYAGQVIGEIWGYTTEGFFIDQDDVNSHAKQSPQMTASPTKQWFAGDIKLKDLNGDGFINIGSNSVDNPGDRSIIGNRQPRYNYSMTFDADYRNFIFSMFFQGIGKQQWYPAGQASIFWGQYTRPYCNIPIFHLGNMWTPENVNAYFPRTMSRASTHPTNKELSVQTKYLQNIAYLRLKNIQLGYNLPQNLVSKIGASALRVYISGENVWTYSPFYKLVGKGHIDVENTGPSDRVFNLDDDDGGDGHNYPMMSSMSFGLNVTF